MTRCPTVGLIAARVGPFVFAAILIVPLLLATHPTVAQDSTKDGSPKFCPTCKHYYPASQRFCGIDGVPLVEAAPKRENAKTCPRCRVSYDSWTKFCPNDGAPLAEPNQSSNAKDPKRTGKNDGSNVVGTIERTPG